MQPLFFSSFLEQPLLKNKNWLDWEINYTNSMYFNLL